MVPFYVLIFFYLIKDIFKEVIIW